MPIHSGADGKIFSGSNQIAEIKSWTIEETSRIQDASTMGSAWAKNISTIKSWSGSCEALWDKADNNGQGSMSVGDKITLNLYPDGNETGDALLSGDVYIASVSRSASYDGIVLINFNFTGTGPLNKTSVTNARRSE